MANNPPRSMAQDAARWYFSNLDPYSSNESNIQILRQPLIALTVKALPTNSFLLSDNNNRTTVNNEEKKNDWREYLQEESTSISDNKRREDELKQEYVSLSRRTKARIEAFLAGCSLCVPGPEETNEGKASTTKNSSISLRVGLSGFGLDKPKSARPRAPSLTEKMGLAMAAKHHQIPTQDLATRLELYIRTLQRVRNLNEECVISKESPKLIRARARYTTNAFVATATYVRNISPVLTRLLTSLTLEMLAVECVSEGISKVIYRIVSEYEHRTSFASLAFLSTPEVNADSVLTPLIIKYLEHLQIESKNLVEECELERMLIRAVDPTMRKMFKTIEFQSIGHLLEVCHSYSKQLSCIELPPNVCSTAENAGGLCNNSDAVRQALRDLRREIITVNGHVLPPVTSRKELVSILTQTINSRTLSASSSRRMRYISARNTKLNGSSRNRGISSSRMQPENDSELSSDGASSIEKQKNYESSQPRKKNTDTVIDISENESSILSNSDTNSLAMESPTETSRNIKRLPSSSRRRRSGNFHLSTIDVLMRRLLIAASRTGNGGDAYFFV